MAEQGSGLLTVLSWNVNGLKKKVKKVKTLLDKRNIDIMCLTETKANPTHQYDSQFPDFAVIGKSVNKLAESKQPSFPGGLLFAYRESLPYKFSKIPNKSHFILWVKADPKKPESNVQMVFAVIYNPPSHKTTKDEILSIMEREYKILADEHKEAKFYLTGDLNAYTYQKLDYPEGSVSDLQERTFETDNKNTKKQASNSGETLLDFCKRTGFRIANGRFGNKSNRLTTRSHTLDYLLCREKDWSFILDFKVDGMYKSNHKALIFTLDTKRSECRTCTRTSEVRFTLKCTPMQQSDEFDMIWYLQTLQELTSIPDGFVEASKQCNYQSEVSNICIQEPFFLQYKLQPVTKLQKESGNRMMHCFSVAPCSDPLLVESILCFYLLYCSSINNMISVVEENVIAAYRHCFKNYPGCLFTFVGAFILATEITPENINTDLNTTALTRILNEVNKTGTHDQRKEYNKLIPIKLENQPDKQIVIWKFAFRQEFQTAITPAFDLDISFAGHQ
ncbi:uncharacterized protein LOC110981792 isoform X3 [Acanthaster planci]|uniref:Uncharacterized protein LOC110981792 isoform X3 n=1 Tax=Acanthaster planci TaxID=133434 RepID=A0A8B7YRT1_ACAPL|nr:uncharacterized protein LOC110981792 isoform X3 [Acanthaster planci]